MTANILMLAAALAIAPAGTAMAPSDHKAHATTGATAPGGAANAAAGGVQLATKEDIKAGLPVVDQAGGAVGKVESISATGAIVATGAARVEIPFGSFGKSDKGLVIAMTKAQLEAAAKGG